MRARGVFIDGRFLVDKVGEPPVFDGRIFPALGVENGDPEVRDGDDRVRDIVGLFNESPELSLLRVEISGLGLSRELSCWAVMVMYLEARDPAVILSERGVPLGLDIGVLKSLCPDNTELGVILPVEFEGVTRPPVDGVTLPLEKDAEGVREPKNEGVILPELTFEDFCPPLEDATDDGR